MQGAQWGVLINMEFSIETLQIILQLLSVVVIPVIMFFYKKIEKIEVLFNELLMIVGELQDKSDINDEELTKN